MTKKLKEQISLYEQLRAEDKYKNASQCYKIYIESDVWKKRRLQVLKRDKNRCRTCWTPAKETREGYLEVHHAHYVDHLFNDDIVDAQLFHISLCVECHSIYRDLEKKRKFLKGK